MPIAIETFFRFRLPQITDVLLQFEAADITEQLILSDSLQLSDCASHSAVSAQDDIGRRMWLRAEGEVDVSYRAEVTIHRRLMDVAALDQMAPHDLPAETVQYLFDSRYCPADRLQNFVDAEFSGTSGGARISAIRDWIADHFTYSPGSSGPNTDALDSLVDRRGICRDYAHVLIAMARASAIPARYVACYAPGVTPPDFHAIAEVFLCDPDVPDGGIWQLIDATGMAAPDETVKIGVGRDAADVSFLTSFGPSEFLSSSVVVKTMMGD